MKNIERVKLICLLIDPACKIDSALDKTNKNKRRFSDFQTRKKMNINY